VELGKPEAILLGCGHIPPLVAYRLPIARSAAR
jgi:hypothetical protein